MEKTRLSFRGLGELTLHIFGASGVLIAIVALPIGFFADPVAGAFLASVAIPIGALSSIRLKRRINYTLLCLVISTSTLMIMIGYTTSTGFGVPSFESLVMMATLLVPSFLMAFLLTGIGRIRRGGKLLVIKKEN